MSHYEYRVDFTLDVNDGEFFWGIDTEWMSNRETAIAIAEELEQRGISAEIKSREVNTTVDYSEVPE